MAQPSILVSLLFCWFEATDYGSLCAEAEGSQVDEQSELLLNGQNQTKGHAARQSSEAIPFFERITRVIRPI